MLARRIGAAAAVTAAWAVAVGAACAQSAPLEAYGALPAVESIKIAPGGRRLALIAVAGENRILAVVDPREGQLLGRVEVGLAKVRDLDWVGDDDLLITTSTAQELPGLDGVTRELFLGQSYSLSHRRLVPLPNNVAGIAPTLSSRFQTRTLPDGPAAFVRLYNFRSRDHDLYRVDLTTGRVRSTVDLPGEAESVVLDARARPVARSLYEERSGLWTLEMWSGQAFLPAWTTTRLLDPPLLAGLGRDGVSALVWAQRDGEEAERYHEVRADGAWTAAPFETVPHGLVFHPATHALAGGWHESEAGSDYVFFDPDMEAAWAPVARALAGQRPQLVGFSHDLMSLVVFTDGGGDSGAYHMIDLATPSMNTIGQAYPTITPAMVGDVRPLAYRAADGLEIHGYLTLPPGVTEPRGLPLVVLAHGGPAARDSGGFDWWAQALASRGYAVMQANFRGSTGYGREFLEAGYGEWGLKMQSDLSDGVRQLAVEGLIDPRRVCIVGASYGGYAALAGVTLEQDVYRCAVSVSGVSDLRRMISREAAGHRRETEAVRYWSRFMGADGPGDRSLDARSPARQATRLQVPVLLIHGRDDTVVPVQQSRDFRAAAQRAGAAVELIELRGEDHWLSRADTRIRMLTETVRFLEAHNPPH